MSARLRSLCRASCAAAAARQPRERLRYPAPAHRHCRPSPRTAEGAVFPVAPLPLQRMPPLHTSGGVSPTAGNMLAYSSALLALRGLANKPLHSAVAEEAADGSRYLTEVRTGDGGKHSFFSDLAYGDGEGDTAPAPMDYAVSALALCTTMTLRLYAERKGWPLERIKVHVREERTKGAGHIPDGLALTIQLEGDVTEEQRQRLLEIAAKCPVKNIMLGKLPTGITTKLVPA